VACVQFADGTSAICSFSVAPLVWLHEPAAPVWFAADHVTARSSNAALLESGRNPTGRVPASPIVHCARASLPIICTDVIWAANPRMPRVARSEEGEGARTPCEPAARSHIPGAAKASRSVSPGFPECCGMDVLSEGKGSSKEIWEGYSNINFSNFRSLDQDLRVDCYSKLQQCLRTIFLYH
jgi:hypothetical protein